MIRAIATFAARDLPESSSIDGEMVSVVVSIWRRKMFAEVRKMFLVARHAEQDVRKRGLV